MNHELPDLPPHLLERYMDAIANPPIKRVFEPIAILRMFKVNPWREQRCAFMVTVNLDYNENCGIGVDSPTYETAKIIAAETVDRFIASGKTLDEFRDMDVSPAGYLGTLYLKAWKFSTSEHDTPTIEMEVGLYRSPVTPSRGGGVIS